MPFSLPNGGNNINSNLGHSLFLGENHSEERRRYASILAALLAIFACAVRLPDLDHAIIGDELYHFLAAQSWLTEGRLRIADGVYQRASLFTIFLAQWLDLFGENIIVARLPSLLAGVALVVVVFLWAHRVAGPLAATIAAIFLALDPEQVQISQFVRFYALHVLLFWLGAISCYHLITDANQTKIKTISLGVSCLAGAAYYLQVTTLIGLVAVAAWSISTLVLTGRIKLSKTAWFALAIAIPLIFSAALWALGGGAFVADLAGMYNKAPLYLTNHSNSFWYYHFNLIIYYPTLWPLMGLVVIIALAYVPRPASFCASIIIVTVILHSFAAAKHMRYVSYIQPFLFVLWGIALARIMPALFAFLEDVAVRVLAWLRLAWLGRYGMVALLSAVGMFLVLSNGAFVRTVVPMFGVTIPPMKRAADWDTAKEVLTPLLSKADIVLTSDELHLLYYLGHYDITISKSRLWELSDHQEFSLDHRTGRPVISQSKSVELIMGCYDSGLVISHDSDWGNPAQLNNEIAHLVEARSDDVPHVGYGIRAYYWHLDDNDDEKTAACARLQADLSPDAQK